MRSPIRRTPRVLGAVALLAAGYLLAQFTTAEPVGAQPARDKAVVPAAAIANPGNDKRVIAYVFGNVPITREDFGEYLIAIHGKEKVRLFVNQRIIEIAAERANVTVTDPEIDAIVKTDCDRLGMTLKDFEAKVLKQRYGTDLKNWRVNSIKPRLMLQKMCANQVKFEEEDLKKVYENLYGEKIVCKVIMWPADETKNALRIHGTIRSEKQELEFDQVARSQVNSDLAARGGEIDPIGRHNGPGTAKIEEVAFKMVDGQVSELINTGGGIIVIKRMKSIPARTDVAYESVRSALIKELTDRQIELAIPQAFAKLNTEAKPLFLLSPPSETSRDMEDQSRRLLNTDPDQVIPKR